MFRLVLYASFIVGAISRKARQQLDQCTAACKVGVKAVYHYKWYPHMFSSTIVAATVVKIVNTVAGTTRTSTIYNDLPSGYTLPPTNEDGTQVATVTYSQQGSTKTTVLAFPTSFRSWADGYTFQGVLPTEKDGETTCMSAEEPSFVPFPSFPQSAVTETPTHTAGPDPKGLLFKFTSLDEGANQYVTAYSDLAAFQECSISKYPLPLVAEPTVRFLSQTVTSFEGAEATSQASGRAGPTTTSAASPSLTPHSVLVLSCILIAMAVVPGYI
ncbi:predicted protein [Uncinocarpus reesii 1704]|uniref:Uncharacterized protein n=1 Tax=Uncinocarpus reesii (strain UAMH 1704) TaxID=336963 RepID=C4JNS9_UNCRE|nr:uncharacterized protein UREG_04399 [Uncinocarpus reesii 1704]EEP79553.1 predicted protein [Uncinocarpus reesii 1704]